MTRAGSDAANDEGERHAPMWANAARFAFRCDQPLLRLPFDSGDDDLPLLKPIRSAILASKRLGI
jgi:hypothetical protein